MGVLVENCMHLLTGSLAVLHIRRPRAAARIHKNSVRVTKLTSTIELRLRLTSTCGTYYTLLQGILEGIIKGAAGA